MTKLDAFALMKLMDREEFDYFSLISALADYQAPRQKIHELLKTGVITRVKKGLYVFGPRYNRAPICLEVLANLIYGPSYLSLEYALSYHGLIPERVVELTSVTTKRSRIFETPVGRFSYRYLAATKYSLGVCRVVSDPKHPFLIASPEKALCDYVTLTPSVELKTREQAHEFLAADLRIEPDQWSRFDSRAFDDLVRVYADPRLVVLRQAL